MLGGRYLRNCADLETVLKRPYMPLLDGLKVVRSSIHGYGIIALRPIAEGATIMEGDGVPYHIDDDFDDTYALIMYSGEEGAGDDPSMLLDLTDQTRWINHSCDPNTEVDVRYDPSTDTGVAWWIALRDIEPGEELTYDYAFDPSVAEPCACGSRQCRGVIVDADFIDQLPKKLRKYAKRARKRR